MISASEPSSLPLLPAIGRRKGGSVYGTGSLASQPSIYSRALLPAQPTTNPAHVTPSTDVLTMEKMTTMMFDFQRQLGHIKELVYG
ncbi:putative tubulin beta-5 chain [Iris pallida]|uniref:Tubulin beta-5 chain n=1 Tax=Iris pallida TaxID=29817 RepID=A0AAX6GIM3_IRIPA|nr:putative tubulin beta-5 chain [Iris pallida]